LGQKTNPIGLRLGINRNWDSVWFDEKNYASKLHEDIILRNYINNRLNHASISRIEISRTSKRVSVTIHTARPGIVIGRGGSEVETLKAELKKWVDYALQNKSLILFDAAYEAFIQDNDIPHSIYEIEGAKDCAIEFRSFSKNAGFTGVRCAFTVIPKNLKGLSSTNEEIELWPLWNRRQSTKFNGGS